MIKKKVTITYLNEHECVFSGVLQEDLKYLNKKYAFFAPNYFFSPLFKLGKWDGKKRFFTMNGLTSTHLVLEIVECLDELGYKNFDIKDNRKNFKFDFPEIDNEYFRQSNITLGEHQVTAINKLLENFGGILRAGTGAGKTMVIACLCDVFRNVGLKTIVIVPNIDLVSQTIETFERLGVEVSEYSGNKKDISKSTVISTWQSLQNNTDILKAFSSLILDECHILGGGVINEIVGKFSNHMPIKIGMTGTIPKDECEQMNLKYCFGEIVYEITSAELIEKGWLADVVINRIELEENFKLLYNRYMKDNANSTISYKEFFNGYFPDYKSEMSFLTKNKQRNETIIDIINEVSSKGNTLILLNSVKHGKLLESQIQNSIFVYGSTKKKNRKSVYKSYADGNNIIHISTYSLIKAGLDLPRMNNLIMIDAGKAFTRVIQSIGRALRKAHDKDKAEVFDVYSNLKYSKKHSKERVQYYNDEKYKHNVQKIQMQPQKVIIQENVDDVDFE